jgi:hypothetical protein
MKPWCAPLSALAFVTFALGCDVDADMLRKDIEKGLKDRGAAITSVTCPDKKYAVDEAFECDGVAEDGTKFKVKAKKGSDGRVSWDLIGRILPPTDLPARIEQNLKRKMDCGTATRIAVKGVVVECTDAKGKVTLTFVDDEGNMSVDQT